MARQGTTATTAEAPASANPARPEDLFGLQGVGSARAWLGTSLASLSALVTWLEQWQALNGAALTGWSRTLASCSLDLDEAQDPEQFMALPARMVNHHLEHTTHQMEQAMQGLFEAQVRWAEAFGAALPATPGPAAH